MTSCKTASWSALGPSLKNRMTTSNLSSNWRWARRWLTTTYVFPFSHFCARGPETMFRWQQKSRTAYNITKSSYDSPQLTQLTSNRKRYHNAHWIRVCKRSFLNNTETHQCLWPYTIVWKSASSNWRRNEVWRSFGRAFTTRRNNLASEDEQHWQVGGPAGEESHFDTFRDKQN